MLYFVEMGTKQSVTLRESNTKLRILTRENAILRDALAQRDELIRRMRELAYREEFLKQAS